MNRPFYPVLFSFLPALILFEHNIGKSPLSVLFLPIVILLLLWSTLFGLFYLFSRDTEWAAVCSLLVHAAFIVFTPIFVVPALLAPFVLSRFNLPLKKITPVANFFAICFVSFTSISIAWFYLTLPEAISSANLVMTRDDLIDPPETSADRPDIYYLIFDRYGSQAVLKSHFDFDNSPFLDALADRGFFCTTQGVANYPKTAFSLASSLNMNYLKSYAGPNHYWVPMYDNLQDHRVGKILKQQGYKYTHLGSNWTPTSHNDFADSNINIFPQNELLLLLYHRSIFRPLLAGLSLFDERREQWERVRYKFDALGRVANQSTEPNFVFAHFLLPHDPYVFDRQGQYKDREQEEQATNDENYLEQLRFTNRKIIRTIDGILEKDKDAVILIQADEGPFPDAYRHNQTNFNWLMAPPDQVAKKLGIINCYRVGDDIESQLYADITPVNSFRIIFRNLFGYPLPNLPDKTFVYANERELYNFSETKSARYIR